MHVCVNLNVSWLFKLYLSNFSQRFGSGSVPTQLIGATLLKGEWKAAVSMILDPREGDILFIVLKSC